MDEFKRLEQNLTNPDPHLEQALAHPDTEASQAAFDTFMAGEHRAELHLLPARTAGRIAVTSIESEPDSSNVVPLRKI